MKKERKTTVGTYQWDRDPEGGGEWELEGSGVSVGTILWFWVRPELSGAGIRESVEPFFDNPRRRRSEELAFFAERAERAGDLPAARAQYAEAARLEEENALAIPADVPRVRSVLAISAVALWLRAEQWDEAARAGRAFLAVPNALTHDGLRELESLVDRAWGREDVREGL